MRLYLIQHGDALAKEADPQRSLSDRGRLEVSAIATFLRGRIAPRRIWHSGKTRALQTAEIFAQALASDARVDILAGIDPLDAVAPVAVAVERWNDEVMIVGHLPFMAKLVSRLVTGAEEPAVASYTPGSIACVVRDVDRRWSLAWMLRPELFAKTP